MSVITRLAVGLAAVGAATVALVAGAASASIPDGSGAITICFVKASTDSGALTPVMLKDTAKGSCPAGYTALSWSQHGAPGPKGDQGAKGDKGEKGDTGATGPAGASTVTFTKRTGSTVTLDGATLGGAFADCLSGEHATGGGFTAVDSAGGNLTRFAAVAQNGPNANGWAVFARNTGSDKLDITVTVVCAK